MKLELKKNMYVRTKDGIIDKILLVEYAEEKRQQYPNHPSKKYWRDKILLLKAGYWRTTQNIIKTSHNIIDLIEVGDIVITPLGEIIQPYGGNIDELKDYWKITKNPIKSIITKEQMEQMAYKVGDK